MLVGIHQSHYLPWLCYIDKLMRSDVFIVLDDVQFSKNGWQNRNKLKTPSGPTILTVPVHARAGQTLDEVRISGDGPDWKKKHWRTVEQHYRKAPYYDDHAPFLVELYRREWTHLIELNRHMLDYLLDVLGIATRVEYASSLDVQGVATERLVHLVKAVGGDAYLSGEFALDAYLDPEPFRESGIELKIQQWTPPTYPQLYGEFIPDLSILDLLMNCGPDACAVLNGRQND